MGHEVGVRDHRASLELTKDHNGIVQVVLRNPQGASARVNLQEGRVMSWSNGKGEELLFSSAKVAPKPPKTRRGGISICFPKIGNGGPIERGLATKNKLWKVEADPPPLPANDSLGKSYVDLLLEPAGADLKCWPLGFECRLRVSLGSGGNLILISRVRNIHVKKPFSFTFLFHTHFSVSDISEVRVEGLETLHYFNNLLEEERFTEQADAMTFESEVDRVYLSSPRCVAVMDHERKRTYVMRKQGLPDTFVWNPWKKKSRAMANFGNDEYKRMICVDGAAMEKGITLKPGEEWRGQIEIAAVASSFCCDDLHDPHLKFFC